MKRALITGVSGFVGRYLAEHLIDQGIEVWGTSRTAPPYLFLDNGSKVIILQSNLDSTEDVYSILEKVRPDYIFHLAGQSNVKKSWEDKEGTFYANVNKTIFLLEACVQFKKIKHDFCILTVGSSEEYGKVEHNELPITEDGKLAPISPYGVSKSAVSMLIKQYHSAYDLNVIHARPFNHIGPGQSLGFVTSDFAKQIVEIEKGIKEPLLRVGDLSSKRDFTDVSDIVRAYYLLTIKGRAGQAYNICSGTSISIQEILNQFLQFSSKNIKIFVDKDKLRPINIKDYYGSNKKVIKETGWRSLSSIEKSLYNIYLYWKENI